MNCTPLNWSFINPRKNLGEPWMTVGWPGLWSLDRRFVRWAMM